jgi:hypothetical protein
MTVTDTHDMVLVHRVFRREYGLLPLMVRQVADGDTRAADRRETAALRARLAQPSPAASPHQPS